MQSLKYQPSSLPSPDSQMSDTFINGAVLALSGGFQDAYTYNTRDAVFSNAQTGNVVLMSQNLMVGNWTGAIRYLLPLLAFISGVLVTEQLQSRFKYARCLHWRQMILLMEIFILILVGFIPASMNILAACLVSFSCAMQVQAFRKINGAAYATTMCIGNLRSGTAALSIYLREHKKEQLLQAVQYFGIILFFAVGAGIGGNLSLHFGIRVIWISSAILMVSFLMMFMKRRRIYQFY